MADKLETKKSGDAKEWRESPRTRQERSTSLTDVHRHPELARRLDVPGAKDASPAKDRRLSLRGVGGEVREQPDNTDQKPKEVTGITLLLIGGAQEFIGNPSTEPGNPCPEKEDKHALRRTAATTSLQRSPQRSPGKTCLLANSTVLLVAAISVALLIGVLAWHKSRSRYGRYPVPPDPRGPLRVRRCRNEACRRIGALLNDALDDNVQPCEDFHAYVCGSGRTSIRARPSRKSSLRHSLGHVTRSARKNVAISSKRTASNQTAVQKAATHLVACDNIVALSDDQTSNVKRVLAEGGIALGSVTENASTPDVLKAMFYMSQVVHIPVLLDVSVEYNVEQRVSLQRPENTRSSHSQVDASYRRNKQLLEALFCIGTGGSASATPNESYHYALEYPYMASVVDDNVSRDVVALMRRISRSFSKVVLRTPVRNSNCTFNSDEVMAGVHAEIVQSPQA
ncbi:hypothetical protein MRX96_052763 [Rhipicephalus microplus]